jgi:hypothetical protein
MCSRQQNINTLKQQNNNKVQNIYNLIIIYNFPLILQKLPVDHFDDLTRLSLVISGLVWFIIIKNKKQ